MKMRQKLGLPMGGGQRVVPGAPPEAEVQEVASDIRTNPPEYDPKSETPELRDYFTENMENIVRYANAPPDQIPEEARGPVDLFNRMLSSQVSKTPIVLRDPSEMKYLPSGTEYITPDNKRGKVP